VGDRHRTGLSQLGSVPRYAPSCRSWQWRGSARLEVTAPARTALNPWGSWTPPAFDVVAHAALGIRIPVDRYEYEGRMHSLWYCDAQEVGRSQWFETAFMVSPFIPRRGRQNPFAIDPGEESAKAGWKGIAEWQVAWPFTPLSVRRPGRVRQQVGWLARRRSARTAWPPQHDARAIASGQLATQMTDRFRPTRTRKIGFLAVKLPTCQQC
jgi:hypothetical protein